MKRLGSSLFAPAVVLALVGILGCAGTAWKSALRDDSPAAYYRFLRDHPDSRYTAAANERLAFHRLRREPTLAGFDRFAEQYPDSTLLDELRPLLEEQAFFAAHARGTPDAYAAFLTQFPRGAFSARAAGNAAYVEARGFGGDTDALRRFSQQHPESDFAAEARRSADSVVLRETSRIDRVGLVVEISPATPEGKRLTQSFTEHALAQYQRAGIELVPIPELATPGITELPSARLVIQHREGETQTSISGDELSRPGLVAETRVSLRERSDGAPIWSRSFELRADAKDHLEGTSLLFGPGPHTRRYWEEFFVPVATWQTNEARRAPLEVEREVVAIDAAGDRAVVLFESGEFRLIQLSDPSAPLELAAFERPTDLTRWNGLRILGERVAVFGDDGLELVGFGEQGPEVELALGRAQIGSVYAVEPHGDALLLAGGRGLLLTDATGGEPVRLMRRVVLGLASAGESLVFTDGETLYVSTLPLLREKRVQGQLRLGRDFGPSRIRGFGTTAVVLGASGVLLLDLSDARQPRVISQLRRKEIGRVEDAVQVRGRLFLLGERGLQLLDPSGHRVVDSVDVGARRRAATMGRYVVTAGERDLEVVDATGFTSYGAAAPAE